MMQKAIVLFYSLSGNTKKVGEFIAEKLDLPFEEIKPIKEINSTGLSRYFWGSKQIVLHEKSELIPLVTNLDDYNTVFIGSPVWLASFAPAIKTLLEDGRLKDKQIAFFYTHDRGVGKMENRIKESVNLYNRLISSFELLQVRDDFETLKDGVLKWSKDVMENSL